MSKKIKMTKGKKKIRIYDDVELLETSPVGIPSYPDAVNRSLIKSIMSKMANEENKEEEKQPEASSSEVSEKPSEETNSEQDSGEQKPEEKEDKSSEPIQMTKESLQELISGVAKELSSPKGLVEQKKEKDESEDLDKMSVGELAIKCGLFNKDDLKK